MSTITLTNCANFVFTDPRGMCQYFVGRINFKIKAFIHTGHLLQHFPSAVRLFGAAETPCTIQTGAFPHPACSCQ